MMSLRVVRGPSSTWDTDIDRGGGVLHQWREESRAEEERSEGEHGRTATDWLTTEHSQPLSLSLSLSFSLSTRRNQNMGTAGLAGETLWLFEAEIFLEIKINSTFIILMLNHF